MISLKNIWAKVCRKWTKIRLQPIRVFCFHHVSDTFNKSYMWECDWVNTDVLKQWVLDMQRKGYQFVSLPEAHFHLQNDYMRCRKYAVLTADDGYKSLLNIPILKLVDYYSKKFEYYARSGRKYFYYILILCISAGNYNNKILIF